MKHLIIGTLVAMFAMPSFAFKPKLSKEERQARRQERLSKLTPEQLQKRQERKANRKAKFAGMSDEEKQAFKLKRKEKRKGRKKFRQ